MKGVGVTSEGDCGLVFRLATARPMTRPSRTRRRLEQHMTKKVLAARRGERHCESFCAAAICSCLCLVFAVIAGYATYEALEKHGRLRVVEGGLGYYIPEARLSTVLQPALTVWCS